MLFPIGFVFVVLHFPSKQVVSWVAYLACHMLLSVVHVNSHAELALRYTSHHMLQCKRSVTSGADTFVAVH